MTGVLKITVTPHVRPLTTEHTIYHGRRFNTVRTFKAVHFITSGEGGGKCRGEGGDSQVSSAFNTTASKCNFRA
ncbi:hypothetical protein E2C01_016867 [Portunus trituberculatus]|uniref:Uncharacterized protein n=1 Tax=Portunus trituberculatus TaxID=210409 RepID=A0A5B7DQ81_PORTR|nr:hypothetical protein [Portunus trituberculatus]